MVLIIWEQWKASFHNELATHYNDKILTDVIIKVDNKQCEVHSFVISLFSTYFQKLIELARQEEECELPFGITLAGYTYEVVNSIISFMYSGEMLVDEQHITEVVHLSKELGIKGLEKLELQIEDHIENNVLAEADQIEDIHSFILNCGIMADIIPILKEENQCIQDHNMVADSLDELEVKQPPRKKKKKIARSATCSIQCSSADTSSTIGSSTHSSSNLKGHSHNWKRRSLKRKYKHVDKEAVESVNGKKMKEDFLKEVEKSLGEEDIFWKNVGMELMLDKDCESVQKSPVKNDNRNPSKVILARFKREMSYIWHYFTSLSHEEKQEFLGQITEETIKFVYTMMLKRETVNAILEKLNLSTEGMTVALLILIVSKKLSVDLAIEAYKVKEMRLVFKNRLVKGVEQYQTTNATLFEIAKACWIPPSCLYVEINRQGIKRKDKFDKFDALLQCTLQTCIEGVPFEDVLQADNVTEFVDDFESILEHHVGRDIVLPLRNYEDRIQDGLSTSASGAMTMAEAAKEFMVPYSVLCERSLPQEDQEESKHTPAKVKIKTEPSVTDMGSEVEVDNASRRGRWSRTDRVLRAALLSAREGMPLEEVFKLYDIKNRRNKAVIKYNLHRGDAPLGESYESRFRKAVTLVRSEGTPISEAANRYIINHSVLWDYFNVSKAERENLNQIRKAKADQIFAMQMAISSDEGADEDVVDSMIDVPDAVERVHVLNYDGTTAEEIITGEDISTTMPHSVDIKQEMTLEEAQGEGLMDSSLDSFNAIMKTALKRCDEEGIKAKEALGDHTLINQKYVDILEFNINRPDAPIHEEYIDRLSKAVQSCRRNELSLDEASKAYIVNPLTLKKKINQSMESAKEENKACKKTDWEVFDKCMKDALRDCRNGVPVDEACFSHRLLNKRYREILEFNISKMDAPIDDPYKLRLRYARQATRDEGMTMALASKVFMVSPYSLWPSRIHRVRSKVYPSSLHKNSVELIGEKLEAFDKQIRSALQSCREGLSVKEACSQHGIKNKWYREIIEFNLNRDDPPLDEDCYLRLQKAQATFQDKKMTVDEIAKTFMISPFMLRPSSFTKKDRDVTMKVQPSIQATKIRERQKLLNFDRQIKSALRSCLDGMSVTDACIRYQLNKRHQKILEFNLNRKDADVILHDPCEIRLQKAKKACIEKTMTMADIAKTFMISPYFLWPSRVHRKDLGKRAKYRRKKEAEKSMVIVAEDEIETGDYNSTKIINVNRTEFEIKEESLPAPGPTSSTPRIQFKMKMLNLPPSKVGPITKRLTIDITDQRLKLAPEKSLPPRATTTSSSSAYQKRFQLALKVCTKMEMSKKAAAEKYKIDLGELSKAYELEWTKKFCAAPDSDSGKQ